MFGYLDLPTLVFLMLAAHAVGDYALQNDFMGKYKNRNNCSELRRFGLSDIWMYLLPCHGMIHGFLVLLITGSLMLALLETVLHILIDHLKCESIIGLHTDQILHLLCKLVWVVIYIKVL